MKHKPVIIVSNPIGQTFDYRAYDKAVQEGHMPRQDYQELATQLGADIASPDNRSLPILKFTWKYERRLKFHLAEALRVGRKLSTGQLVVSTSEKVGVPLAVVLQMRRCQAMHVVIAHKLSSGSKVRLFKAWPVQRTFKHIICVSQAQADFARRTLSVPAAQVHFVYDKVDQRFFYPQQTTGGDYVLAVGQEQRDYATLLQALSGTGLRLVMVNSSSWTEQSAQHGASETVQVIMLAGIPYRDLRDLYAGARMIVLPLHNVDYAAGINAALETLAMGKPLVISETRGLTGYFEQGETAVTVPPGNPAALRDTILALWSDTDTQRRLGENARQLVEEKMTLEHYLARISHILSESGALP